MRTPLGWHLDRDLASGSRSICMHAGAKRERDSAATEDERDAPAGGKRRKSVSFYNVRNSAVSVHNLAARNGPQSQPTGERWHALTMAIRRSHSLPSSLKKTSLFPAPPAPDAGGPSGNEERDGASPEPGDTLPAPPPRTATPTPEAGESIAEPSPSKLQELVEKNRVRKIQILLPHLGVLVALECGHRVQLVQLCW